MSIWGPRPAENDDAADWLSELVDALSIDLLEEAVSEVADPAHVGYVEIPECCIAVAAADVLCQLLGTAGSHPILEQEEIQHLEGQLQQHDQQAMRKLIGQALVAVQRVIKDEENSELHQVWDEDELDTVQWMQEMKALEVRLQAVEIKINRASPD